MGNFNNLPSSDFKTIKDKDTFINNDNQINILISNEDSFNSNNNTVSIKESKKNSEQNQNAKNQPNIYSLLSTNVNQENNNISNVAVKERKKHHSRKNKRKKNKNASNERNFYKNIYKKKSIIGICLNLFFWLWNFLLFLDHNNTFQFPRASPDKKIDMIYTGMNNDNIIGSFFSTILCTILNYFIIILYPEIIFFLSYIIYVVYSILNASYEKFKDKCMLSRNIYIFLVLLTFGEIYKLWARKYLDI